LPVSGREFSKLQLLADLQRSKSTRENFDALATFAPAVPTDANGRASVKVKLPDSLTRYRVMAVAVAGRKQFGANESNITARLPLMVRPSAPRFLNFGDKIELPVVVQNQTDSRWRSMSRSSRQRRDHSRRGPRVSVPANDRVKSASRFQRTRGHSRFQIAGVSGGGRRRRDRIAGVTPATTKRLLPTARSIKAHRQPVKAPSDAIKQFGGLEISTSSTELRLTDGFIYLVAYPFECTEQLSSSSGGRRLKDVLTAFKARSARTEGSDGRRRSRHQAVGVSSKRDGASDSGGVAISRGLRSIHVAHAIQRAGQRTSRFRLRCSIDRRGTFGRSSVTSPAATARSFAAR
jgi:hypothetical protein